MGSGFPPQGGVTVAVMDAGLLEDSYISLFKAKDPRAAKIFPYAEMLYNAGRLAADNTAAFINDVLTYIPKIADDSEKLFGSPFLAAVLNSANLTVAKGASIFNSDNMSAAKAASIFDHANLTAAKAASVIQTGGISYPKIKAILQHVNLSDAKFNSIFDALTFDYTQTSIAEFTNVENDDPDANGSETIADPTYSCTDGGGGYATWTHCYEQPLISKTGSLLLISGHVTTSDAAGTYHIAGFGVVLKDDAENLHTILISNYSTPGYYGRNDQPEPVASVDQFNSLPSAAGTYLFRGVYGLPWTVNQMYAAFLGLRVYNDTDFITLEANGLRILIISAASPPAATEEVRYTT